MNHTYAISTWLFLRALGLVYLAAFLSFAVQLKALIGANGIIPAQGFLKEQKAGLGRKRFWVIPTLCWIRPRDQFFQLLVWTGVVLSVVQVVGIAPLPILILLWALYLSPLNVSDVFLGYQWDALLLETGFLAIWLAPWELVSRWPPTAEPNGFALWLAWWLLFRLMFSSGVVKLRSGDPTWKDLSALKHHYETQPLPTPLAWHFHQLPDSFHKASCAVMFLIELAIPFLFFAPAPVCYIAAGLTIGLMLIIMATGNYCFFNLLTIALCLLLLDDRVFGRSPVNASHWNWWALPPLAILVLLSIRPLGQLFNLGIRIPFLQPVLDLLQPFHLVNGYGLFAVMTTRRPEIIVEASADGVTWKPYEFRWKPGNVTQRLRYCMPHQPRLDWQMWFAALGDLQPWFINFLTCLLEGSPAVLALLRMNPFPDAPPRYIRTMLYRYSFADLVTHQRTGALWQRELLGPYMPIVTLGENPKRAA